MYAFDGVHVETDILIWVSHIGQGKYEFAIKREPSYEGFKNSLLESKKHGICFYVDGSEEDLLLKYGKYTNSFLCRLHVENFNNLLSGLIVYYRYVWEHEVHNNT